MLKLFGSCSRPLYHSPLSFGQSTDRVMRAVDRRLDLKSARNDKACSRRAKVDEIRKVRGNTTENARKEKSSFSSL